MPITSNNQKTVSKRIKRKNTFLFVQTKRGKKKEKEEKLSMVNCVTLNPLDKQISTYTNARVYLANEIGQKRGIHGCQTFHASKNESLGPLGPINCSPRYYAKLMPTESRAEITRIINSNWTHDGQLRVSRMTVSQTCECTEYVARSLQHPAIPQGMHGCS